MWRNSESESESEMEILIGAIPIQVSDWFPVRNDEMKYENCPNLEGQEERRVEELEERPRLEGQEESRVKELKASAQAEALRRWRIACDMIKRPDRQKVRASKAVASASSIPAREYVHKKETQRNLALWKDGCVRAEDINSYLPGCIYECENCGRQSCTLQALRGCKGSILIKLRRITGGHGSGTKSSPARARPSCLPWPHSCDPTQRVCPVQGGSRMRGEIDDLAPVDRAIDTVEDEEMCHLQARKHRSLRLHGNDFGEGTSTMHSPVSGGASLCGNSDGLNHEHARSIPLQGRRLSLDGTAKLTESHSKYETWDPHFSQARGGHGPDHLADHLELTLVVGGDESGLNRGKARPRWSAEYDGPTMSNVFGEGTSTMLNPGSSGEVIGLAREEVDIEKGEIGGTPSLDQVQAGQARVLWGDFSTDDSAHENREMERGGTHPSDHLPQDSGSADLCPYHSAQEDNWQRLTTMIDPLLTVIFQGVCSLLAYKSSDGSSLAGNVLFYVLVFDCVLGFFFALGGKWFGCPKLKAIGLLFAALGFLMTMALVIICKIG